MAQQSQDSGMAVVFLTFFIVTLVGYVLWEAMGDQIMWLIKEWRILQMQLIVLIMGTNYTYFDALTNQNIPYQDTIEWMKTLEMGSLAGDQQALFARMSMDFYKWPIMLILACFFIWSIFRGPGTRFKRNLNLEGLMFEQAKSFPVIKPFIKFNPLKQNARVPGTPVPAELPPFAEALSPEEWIAFNRIPMPDGKLDVTIAKHAFVNQLDRRWGGISSLKEHERALFAAFALKSVRKRKEAEALLNDVASSWTIEKGLRLSSKTKREINSILKNAKISKTVYMHANQHAYVKTALVRALQFARQEGGVLASAQFVWLRAHDRGLWYPLNNLGRKSFHAEAMGVMSHFVAEKGMGRAIPVPQIDTAITSIESYLKNNQPIVIPKLDYKESKQRSGILKPASGKA